jgi:restriction system protein
MRGIPMKLKMAENSLFAILLRARWWVSWLVAAGVFGVARLVLPEGLALFAALPLMVIAVVAGWQQFRTPSGERLAAALDRLRDLPWETFASALEAGFRREGYGVARLPGAGGAADFELRKAERLSLAAARRWKAARTGVEPLRELQAAGAAREAAECLFIVAGDVTDTARAYAAEHRIRLVEGVELCRLARE